METVACRDCDLLQQIPPLPPRGKARCARCGELLVSRVSDRLDRLLALTVAAAVALVVANTMPLMGLSAVGRESSTTIIGGALEMWNQGSEITAVIVAFFVVIAPAAHVAFLLVVLFAVRYPPAPRWVGAMLRSAHLMEPWSMTEVMMLGILVSLVKIAELAQVIPGIGMYAAGIFIFLLATIIVSFEPHDIWSRVDWADEAARSEAERSVAAGLDAVPAIPALTAEQAGILSCLTCGLLSRPVSDRNPGYCPRCGAKLIWRRRNSLQTTWALLLAATICYLPANALPVMGTTALGETEFDTIIGGVIYLYKSGSWPLALIVLVASVMIPLGKILALAWLLLTVRRKSAKNTHDRARIYRMVEFIGKWSMLDVFVAVFTVALVQLQPLMSVEPGLGVVFFMAVVVLTMLAAQSFDPRLIWDAASERQVKHG